MSDRLKQKLLKLLDDAGYQVHPSEIEDVYKEGENYVYIGLDENDDTYVVSRWFTEAKDFGASNLIENVTYEEASEFLQKHITAFETPPCEVLMKTCIVTPYAVGQNCPSKPSPQLVQLPDDKDEAAKVLKDLFNQFHSSEEPFTEEFSVSYYDDNDATYGNVVATYDGDALIYLTYVHS